MNATGAPARPPVTSPTRPASQRSTPVAASTSDRLASMPKKSAKLQFTPRRVSAVTRPTAPSSASASTASQAGSTPWSGCVAKPSRSPAPVARQTRSAREGRPRSARCIARTPDRGPLGASSPGRGRYSHRSAASIPARRSAFAGAAHTAQPTHPAPARTSAGQDRMGEHGRGRAGQEHGAHLAEAHQGRQGQPGRGPRAGRIAERLDQLGESRREKGDAARRIRNRRTERDTRQRERRGLTGEAAPGPADDPEREPIEHARGDQHPAEGQHRHDEDPARRGETREAHPGRRDAAKRPHRDRQESQDPLRQHLEGENGHHGAERPEGTPAGRLQSRRRRRHPCRGEDQHGQRAAQRTPER